VGTLTGVICLIPGGALTDAVRWKRGLVAMGILAIAGAALMLAGAGGTIYLIGLWRGQGYGNLDPFRVMRLAIPAVTALTLGLQVAASGLLLSLLKWAWRSRSSL
jgi:hypothetical protein